jgi:hypothetical protein
MSSSSPILGRLEPVPLRTVWSREDHRFTPWLAEPTNLDLLGTVLGLELELQGTEQSIGPFRADIVCRERREDRLVLIENQLERTDHTHLGQLITYTAGLDTATIVWIAAQFTEEHRGALDWLNTATDANSGSSGLKSNYGASSIQCGLPRLGLCRSRMSGRSVHVRPHAQWSAAR